MPLDLIWDTETTGKVIPSAGYGHPSQPHIVQIAAVLADGPDIRAQLSLIVNPGVPIPAEASAIHGIDDKIAKECGVSPMTAMSMFNRMAAKASRLVAHNAWFDATVTLGEFARLKLDIKEVAAKSLTCTMMSACNHLAIPKEKGKAKPGDQFKWPSLEECWSRMVPNGGKYDAHDALADTLVCHRILRELRISGVPLVGPRDKIPAPYEKGEEPEKVLGWLDELISAGADAKLDGFQRKFLDDFAQRRSDHGDTLRVSEKQLVVLRRIGTACGVTVP